MKCCINGNNRSSAGGLGLLRLRGSGEALFVLDLPGQDVYNENSKTWEYHPTAKKGRTDR